jgi:hypothetical protein
MSETDTGDEVTSARVRAAQIVAAALLAGVLVFAGIAVSLVQQRGRGFSPPDGMPVISYAAVTLFAFQLAVWRFLPDQLANNQVGKIARGTWMPGPGVPATVFATDSAKLLSVFQTKTLVANALLEAVALLGCVAHLLEGQRLALGVVGGAVLLMLVTFPTRANIAQWLAERQARIDEIRQSGDLSAPFRQ